MLNGISLYSQLSNTSLTTITTVNHFYPVLILFQYLLVIYHKFNFGVIFLKKYKKKDIII